MKNVFGFARIFLVASILTALILLEGTANAALTFVSVSLDSANPGALVSPLFSGLSYEMSTLNPVETNSYFFTPTNQALVRMFRTLGVKSLRVGGNTADRNTIKISDAQDADSLFAFARAAGVKVIYTV